MRTERSTLMRYSQSLGRLVSVSKDRSIRSYEGYGRKSAVIKIPDNQAHLTVRRYSAHDFGYENELNSVHVVRGGHAHHLPLLSFDRIQGANFTYRGFTPEGDSWKFSAESPDQMIGFLASLFNPGQLSSRKGIEVEFVPGSNRSMGNNLDFYKYMAMHVGAPIISTAGSQRPAAAAS